MFSLTNNKNYLGIIPKILHDLSGFSSVSKKEIIVNIYIKHMLWLNHKNQLGEMVLMSGHNIYVH